MRSVRTKLIPRRSILPIAAGSFPRAQPRSRGLIFSIPGTRQGLRVIDDHGSATADGTYYYETSGRAAPKSGFDYIQELTQRVVRVQIKLLDGSLATVRSWDGVARRWHFIKIGQPTYPDSKDSVVVTFPVHASLARINGVLKRTAASLAEIKLPSLLPDDAQLAEVNRLTEQLIANLPVDDEGRKVLMKDRWSQIRMTLDTERGVERNKKGITIRQNGTMTVDAVLCRPLRAARPWSFGVRGVFPEEFDPSEGTCVSHQLAAVLKKQLNIQEADMDWLFDEIFNGLCPPGAENSPCELEAEDGSIERKG